MRNCLSEKLSSGHLSVRKCRVRSCLGEKLSGEKLSEIHCRRGFKNGQDFRENMKTKHRDYVKWV